MLIFLCVNVQHEHVQKHEGTTMFNNAFFNLNNCLNNVPPFLTFTKLVLLNLCFVLFFHFLQSSSQ